MSRDMEEIRFIDSHTEGEPTRTILSGGPALGAGSVAEQLERLREQDWFRQSILGEPRGWDALVGALLVPSSRPDCAAGVIFLNNAGYLGMCGHGTIGVAVTLYRLGRIGLGRHRLESPVGVVEVDLLDAHRVAIQNVPSYRYLKQVRVEVDGLGPVVGDVAWGGNWFFLAEAQGAALRLENVEQLTQSASAVRRALEREGISGKDGAVIDHIELCGPPVDPSAQGRNFVLCPGGAYDRSPCGTGTSAKLACLAADGDLAPGETWVQESVIGSRFAARYVAAEGGRIVPTIEGSAYVYAEGTIVREPGDPFRDGIVRTNV